MNILKLGTAASLTAALFFAGCSKNDSATSVENKEQKVSFSYELSAAFSQRVYNNLPATRAFENVIADMIITDNISGKEDTLDWYLAIDEDPQVVEINSNMTVVLEPSTYTFALTIEKGDHKYVGTSDPKQLDDTNKKIVALNVHPVIGPTNLTFNVTDLPRLKFSYKSDDLKNLANPKIGYVIDEGAEVIVALDKTDGTNSTNDVTVANESGSTVYLNIPEGDHTISLKLYDGDKQVGKSKDARKTIKVAAGMSETMDLIPLHAEATVTIGVDGGTGTINVAVPQEVINEVGGVTNLTALVTVTGKKNGGAGSQPISNLADGIGVWNGSVTYPSLNYEDSAMITVDFTDNTTKELIGNVMFKPVIFNVEGTSLLGDLSLIRRAVISGDILATTGVNVYDAENNPVKGAIITVDGDTVGITGDAWGTDGYLKFHHTKGEVTIKAVDPVSGMEKDTTVTLENLGVDNFVLQLAAPVYGVRSIETFSINGEREEDELYYIGTAGRIVSPHTGGIPAKIHVEYLKDNGKDAARLKLEGSNEYYSVMANGMTIEKTTVPSDATIFYVVDDLSGQMAAEWVSFESKVSKEHFLRHTGYVLYVHPKGYSGAPQGEVYLQDASWRVVEAIN